MRWQIMKSAEPVADPVNHQAAWIHDDGVIGVQPGEPEFSTADIEAFVGGLDPAVADGFSYVGPSC